MARIYSLKERRDWSIAEDRRELLLRGTRVSRELAEALRSGDGRRVYGALLADARKPGAWFPISVKSAFGRAHKTKTDEAYAELHRDARDVYVNCETESDAAAKAAGE